MNLLDELTRERFLAIVRGRDPHAVRETVRHLVDLDVRLVEVSLTGAGPLDAIAAAVARAAETGAATLVGAGTVVTADDLRAALSAGARFVVTPALTEGFTEAVRQGVPVLAGALTPTEVVSAWRAGATAVKIFPASAMAPGYLRALRDPFPDVPLVPVGGVDAVAARACLEQGAVAVGVGGPLLGDAADGGPLDPLAGRLAAFRTAVAR